MGRRAISGAATFIKQDGAITATVTAAMRGSITSLKGALITMMRTRILEWWKFRSPETFAIMSYRPFFFDFNTNDGNECSLGCVGYSNFLVN